MKGASALGLGMEGGAVRNLTRFTLHGIASLPEGGFEIVRIPPGHTVGGGMADGRTRDVDFVTSAAPEVKQEGGKTVFVFDQAVQGMKIGDRQLVDIVERNDGVITFKETRRLAGGIKVQTIGQMNAGRPVEYAPVEYALKAADQGGADSAD